MAASQSAIITGRYNPPLDNSKSLALNKTIQAELRAWAWQLHRLCPKEEDGTFIF